MLPAAAPQEGRSFRPLFERWASRVRGRLALRYVLAGAAAGLLLGVGVSALSWRTRHGALRPSGAAGGLLGAALGLSLSRRRRWADEDVALYLDARLDTDEAIATAVEFDRQADGEEGSARAVVLSQATLALVGATPARLRAPLWRSWHASIPVAVAAIGWISLAPLPASPAGPAPPGVDKVRLSQLAGLEKIIALAEMSPRDAAQRARLEALAAEARKLREKLRDGVEKREAQADLAGLRDGITAEKLSLGDGEQRQGMESALGKLGENPDLKQAQKALGDRDLVSLDEAMERLANKLEKGDRARAQETLEEAAEAARRNGAPGVGKALEEQKKRLAEQGARRDELRELAKALGEALGEEGQEARRDFDKSGSGKDGQKLADALEHALEGLTPAQRKQLAENLARKMAGAGEDELGPSKQQRKALAEQLDTPEGRKQLEDELRKMAETPPEGSEEGERQKGLDGAEEGAGEAGRELGGGVPMPVAGAGGPGDKGPSMPGAGGPGGGGGHVDHKGLTGVIEGGEGSQVRARASGRLNKGTPMPGVVMGRSAGRAGETANVQGTGALGVAAPGEIGGVDRSDVPGEYREQVGRYFQPK